MFAGGGFCLVVLPRGHIVVGVIVGLYTIACRFSALVIDVMHRDSGIVRFYWACWLIGGSFRFMVSADCYGT